MSLIADLVQSVFDPNRDPHAIPMLDGPLSPNADLDAAREVAPGFDQPDDVVEGADGHCTLATTSPFCDVSPRILRK